MKSTFEPVPDFTVISDDLFSVQSAGYKIDFNDRTHYNFSAAAFWDDSANPEGLAQDYIELFYNLFGAWLCSFDGVMYAVEYFYSENERTMVPCIWQRVKSV